MRKRLVIVVSVFTVLVLLATPAHAGGSPFGVPGDQALVGSTVTGIGQIGNGTQAPVSAGPWFATLRSVTSGVESIALGPVQIAGSNFYGWKARITFTVPDLPTGEYWVEVRNAAGEGVEDLVGASFVIAHTPVEADLWDRASRAEQLAETRLRAVKHLHDRQDRLKFALKHDEVTLNDRQATIERQTDRLTASGARIAELESELADGSPTVTWTYALAALAALLLAAGAFGLGRRSYATRTLVTGASRSWTENQEPPASAEPNTSPLVAPK